MSRMWDVGQKSVADLLDGIKHGSIALPQFQRPLVWGKADWIPFLMTILQGRPTGMLLLLEDNGDSSFAPREIERAPKIESEKVEWLLLDGQQRLTTLYWASQAQLRRGRARAALRLRLAETLARGSILEEDFAVVPNGAVPGVPELARAGDVTFDILTDQSRLEAWRGQFIAAHFGETGNPSGEFVNRVISAVPGLLAVEAYQFPFLQLKRTTPLPVVADVFEGMNRRGQQLNQFDLMVARLYREQPDGTHFDLRTEWESALEESKNLERLGVDARSGMLPLQVIAKQVSRVESAESKVHGINGSDVLELLPEHVSARERGGSTRFARAVRALDDAAGFLIKHCGVNGRTLLPQQAMLIPLADQFLRPVRDRLERHQLKLWFFSVGLGGDYYGSVNSYADRDCNQLLRWLNEGVEPDSVASLTRSSIEELDLMQAFSRDGSILGKAVYSLLVMQGACDWRPGLTKLHAADDTIEIHHMVPESRLKTWFPRDPDSRRPIAGLTPVTSRTNRSIRSDAPRTVITRLSRNASATMRSHAVSSTKLTAGYASEEKFLLFCEDRQVRLRKAIITALGL